MKDGVMELRPGDPDETVACGSCTVCCHQAVLLVPSAGDDASLYETTVSPMPNLVDGSTPSRWLKRKPDGSCVYLDGGCSIYDRRPKVCRAFSCVGWVEKIIRDHPRPERRRMLRRGDLDPGIWREGMKRR